MTAGSVVTQDVKKATVVKGNPAKYHKEGSTKRPTIRKSVIFIRWGDFC